MDAPNNSEIKYVEEPSKVNGTGGKYVIYKVTRIGLTNDSHAIDNLTSSSKARAEASNPVSSSSRSSSSSKALNNWIGADSRSSSGSRQHATAGGPANSPFHHVYMVEAGSNDENHIQPTAQNGSKVCPHLSVNHSDTDNSCLLCRMPVSSTMPWVLSTAVLIELSMWKSRQSLKEQETNM